MTNTKSEIKNILFRIAGEKYRDLVIIALAWKSVVGEFLSERYKVKNFENKIVFIEAVNHLWMQDFVLYRQMYLKKLREETKLEIENILVMLKS